MFHCVLTNAAHHSKIFASKDTLFPNEKEYHGVAFHREIYRASGQANPHVHGRKVSKRDFVRVGGQNASFRVPMSLVRLFGRRFRSRDLPCRQTILGVAVSVGGRGGCPCAGGVSPADISLKAAAVDSCKMK